MAASRPHRTAQWECFGCRMCIFVLPQYGFSGISMAKIYILQELMAWCHQHSLNKSFWPKKESEIVYFQPKVIGFPACTGPPLSNTADHGVTAGCTHRMMLIKVVCHHHHRLAAPRRSWFMSVKTGGKSVSYDGGHGPAQQPGRGPLEGSCDTA